MDNSSNKKRLLKNVECYLTSEARRLVMFAEEAGMDRDLAIACLEQMMKEDEIFTLDD